MPFVVSVRIHNLDENVERKSTGDDASSLLQLGGDSSVHGPSIADDQSPTTPSRTDIQMSDCIDDELEYSSSNEEDMPYITPLPEISTSTIPDKPANKQPFVPKSMDVAADLHTFYEILNSTFNYIKNFNMKEGKGRKTTQSPRSTPLTLEQEVESSGSCPNPGDQRPAFRNSDYRQMTLNFMALDAMHKKDEPVYAPRLTDEFEALFYVSFWRGLGARGGGKVDRRCAPKLWLPREFRSFTFDTVKNAKRRLFLDARYGRPVVKNIMFVHPITMHTAVAWYEVMRCSYSGKTLNATRRAKHQEEGKEIPARLLDEETENIPPGAMMYYTGAQPTNLICNAPCCRTHWARWAKKMNLNKNLDDLWESKSKSK